MYSIWAANGHRKFQDGTGDFSPFLSLADLNGATFEMASVEAALRPGNNARSSCWSSRPPSRSRPNDLRRSAECRTNLTTGAHALGSKGPDSYDDLGLRAIKPKSKRPLLPRLPIGKGQRHNPRLLAEQTPPPGYASHPGLIFEELSLSHRESESVLDSAPPSRCHKHSKASHARTPPHLNVENRELVHYNKFEVESEPGSRRYTECISVSLEEIFYGKHIVHHFTKKYISGQTSRETLELVMPPGSLHETLFSFPQAGHQVSEGGFQDINFIIIMQPHPLKYEVQGDDLSLHVSLSWTDQLYDEPCKFRITGVDGEAYAIDIDYNSTKMTHGIVTLKGAGMPKHGSSGDRGNLIIEWEIGA